MNSNYWSERYLPGTFIVTYVSHSKAICFNDDIWYNNWATDCRCFARKQNFSYIFFIDEAKLKCEKKSGIFWNMKN